MDGAQCVEGRPGELPRAVASAHCHGLLREVLLRLTLPTSLVRAALVCRRWRLRVTSDPDFLRRFRGLHPPRLLGSCVDRLGYPKLVPPRDDGLPRELAAVACRANDYFSGLRQRGLAGDHVVLDLRNGRMLISVIIEDERTRFALAVCSPLQPARSVAYLPWSWPFSNKDGFHGFEFLPEDGGDGMSYVQVRVILPKKRSPHVVLAKVVACQAGVRGDCHATAPIELPTAWSPGPKRGVLCGGKFYVLCDGGDMAGYIFGLDLVAMSMIITELELSRGEGSKLYLIDVNMLQICVWLHDTESNHDGTR